MSILYYICHTEAMASCTRSGAAGAVFKHFSTITWDIHVNVATCKAFIGREWRWKIVSFITWLLCV